MQVKAEHGRSLTFPWNDTSNINVSRLELWGIPSSNFSQNKERILHKTTPCNEMKKYNGKDLKVVAFINGDLVQRSRILPNEHNFFGRFGQFNFTGHFPNGQWWWTLDRVEEHYVDNVYVLCLQENDKTLTFPYGYARISIIKSKVDGGYGDYGPYGECSKSCGGGVQSKTRECNKPAPQYGGKPCEGPNKESQACNTDACPNNKVPPPTLKVPGPTTNGQASKTSNQPCKQYNFDGKIAAMVIAVLEVLVLVITSSCTKKLSMQSNVLAA